MVIKMDIVDVKGRLHDSRILSVISHSVYRPSEEKLAALADKFESDKDIRAFAYDGDGVFCGVIVLKELENGEFEIRSIAVAPSFRSRGIASILISYAVDTLKCSLLKAETDEDAVGFYRKYGFHIESLGEKYPGTVRYLCLLRTKKSKENSSQ